jgi:acetoacetyl-[acyl-carrier protein] synthase|tara:strand:- start:1663 stop:3318 length:1656 start_codon:yes stop_codon:yes gene_type:complete
MENLKRLPVICSMGGLNSGGRTSGNISYSRLVYENLSNEEKKEVLKDLISLSEEKKTEKEILSGTLIRQIDDFLDPKGLMTKQIGVNAGAKLPDFYEIDNLYNSKQHPRGIKMTVFGVNDALYNLGINWREDIQPLLDPNRVAVFAGPAIGQLDEKGLGGLMQSRLQEKRASSKHLSMSLIEMSADFINAYILGSVGKSGQVAGACATFFYNLNAATTLIKSNEVDFAVIGSAEAPINPEVTDGFFATTGIADDKKILAMQERHGEPFDKVDFSKACRPFGDNCGLVLGESSQFAIVTSLEFAIEIGAEILCAVPNVFINSDGIKKSISSPGIGNYLTMGQAFKRYLKDHEKPKLSCVIAHGTGTFQNRSTESDVLSKCATSLEMKNLKVTGLKGYLGHTMGPAGGDQLACSLGIFDRGIIPGLISTPKLADDVITNNLNFCMENEEIDTSDLDAFFLNAKGFGGNNATTSIYKSNFVTKMLPKLFSKSKLTSYEAALEKTRENKLVYNSNCLEGNFNLIYRANEEILNPETDLEMTSEAIKLKDYPEIKL